MRGVDEPLDDLRDRAFSKWVDFSFALTAIKALGFRRGPLVIVADELSRLCDSWKGTPYKNAALCSIMALYQAGGLCQGTRYPPAHHRHRQSDRRVVSITWWQMLSKSHKTDAYVGDNWAILAALGPIWYFFYPNYACWRHVMWPFTEKELKRRRFFWQEQNFPELISSPGSRRLAVGAVVAIGLADTVWRNWTKPSAPTSKKGNFPRMIW